MKKLFLALSVVAVLFSGCKKEETASGTCSDGIKNQNETGVDCGGSCTACTTADLRIKTKTRSAGGNSYTSTFTYDNRGRVISILDTYKDSIIYTYNNNTVIEAYLGSFTFIYTLNSAGYATSVFEIESGGDTLGSIQRVYDAEGHIIEEGASRYSWLDGNLMGETHNNGSNTYTFDYYSDKLNTIGNENMGKKYLGKSSKNLVSAFSEVGIGSLETYIYEFDFQNRVTKVTSTSSGSTIVDTYAYY